MTFRTTFRMTISMEFQGGRGRSLRGTWGLKEGVKGVLEADSKEHLKGDLEEDSEEDSEGGLEGDL